MDSSTNADKDYLVSLDILRGKLDDIQSEVADCERKYPAYASEEGWLEAEYKFNSCLEFLGSKNLKILQLNSEAGMLAMINDLRATGADAALINFATEYWENFDSVMDLVTQVKDKYNFQVLNKLLLMFNNQMLCPTKTNMPLTVEYCNQVMQTMTTIDRLYSRLRTLCQSYRTKVDKDLFEKLSQETLLIVRLPRDIVVKLKILISLSNDLLNRETKFVTAMTAALLECRRVKLEHEKRLAEKRDEQLDKINSVYLATLLLDKNKEQVQQLDRELDELQAHLSNKENALHSTKVEMQRDQNAIEFLNHTISQTKRNQRLMAKRQHLLKTQQSLEKKLEQISGELKTVNEVLQQKTLEKDEMNVTLKQNTLSYTTVTEDLNAFSDTLDEIEKETKWAHTHLIDIEIIHCIKTSPENIEEIRDRPQSVKIARSLRDKITRKRLKNP
ncbi:chromosome partition protein Smc-like [Watersipora subatra]|uniref:chromosome partition protein Smc-like n=1 Tax=Watersipora subatra TaxID=2589382 RepID=UPI00355B14A7